ncbi:MAG: hypothetical protein ABEH38_02685 [Flavobacteriales bacterium]
MSASGLQIAIPLILIPISINAQGIDEKAASEAFNAGAYEVALRYYQGLVKEGASDPESKFRYGVCAVQVPSVRSRGLELLQKLSSKGKLRSRFWQGVGEQLSGKHEQALDYFHAFRRSGNTKISPQEVERRVQISVRAQVYRTNKVHVRSRPVRPEEDLLAERAYMTHDGQTVFFQGEGGTILLGTFNEGGFELSDSIPLERNMKLAGIASNGNSIVLKGLQEGSSWRTDLYRLQRQNGKWSSPEPFGKTVNSNAREGSAWINSNGRLMIFSSAREDGNGGLDLYIVKKLPTGDWAKARNLSPAVNTPHDESAPCLMPDQRTLYFLSQGHRSMGGKDIFRTYFEAEKKRWVVPQNPGYPVNSSGDERTVSVSGEEARALITRKIPRAPYRVTERMELLYQDTHIEVVKGKVFAKEDHEPIKAELRVLDTKERDVQGVYRSRSDDGSFILAIKPGKDYEVVVEAEGYKPRTMKVSVKDKGLEIGLKKK